MAASPILHLFKKRLCRLRRNLVAPEKLTRQKERLHQLRVEMKKWRAGLRLLRIVDPAFPYPEVYEPFKILFSDAGQLRFWQLQRQILNHSAPVPPGFAQRYRAYIRQRLREALHHFRKTIRRAGLLMWRDVKKEFRQSCDACTPDTVQAYFDSLQKAIAAKAKLHNRRRASELHELRKLLKEYANNRQLAIKYFKLDPGPPTGLPTDHARFDTLLGQWHDQDVACAQLAEDLRTQGWEGELLNEGKKVWRGWRRTEREMWGNVVEGLHPGADS